MWIRRELVDRVSHQLQDGTMTDQVAYPYPLWFDIDGTHDDGQLRIDWDAEPILHGGAQLLDRLEGRPLTRRLLSPSHDRSTIDILKAYLNPFDDPDISTTVELAYDRMYEAMGPVRPWQGDSNGD
jgi:hypothetical protein